MNIEDLKTVNKTFETYPINFINNLLDSLNIDNQKIDRNKFTDKFKMYIHSRFNDPEYRYPITIYSGFLHDELRLICIETDYDNKIEFVDQLSSVVINSYCQCCFTNSIDVNFINLDMFDKYKPFKFELNDIVLHSSGSYGKICFINSINETYSCNNHNSYDNYGINILPNFNNTISPVHPDINFKVGDYVKEHDCGNILSTVISVDFSKDFPIKTSSGNEYALNYGTVFRKGGVIHSLTKIIITHECPEFPYGTRVINGHNRLGTVIPCTGYEDYVVCVNWDDDQSVLIDTEFKSHNYFKSNGNYSDNSDYSDSGDYIYNITKLGKQIPDNWESKITSEGIVCWVWDKGLNKYNNVQVIDRYDNTHEYFRYYKKGTYIAWKNAEPVINKL